MVMTPISKSTFSDLCPCNIYIFFEPKMCSFIGEEEEDHDNRKLRKADRMKLVVKNKEEGTELFK